MDQKESTAIPTATLNVKQTTRTRASNTFFFKELVPSILPLLKIAHQARTCWYHLPFHQIDRPQKNTKRKRLTQQQKSKHL